MVEREWTTSGTGNMKSSKITIKNPRLPKIGLLNVFEFFMFMRGAGFHSSECEFFPGRLLVASMEIS